MPRQRILLLLLTAVAGCRHGAPTPAQASSVHERALVFDAHCDTLMRVVDDGLDLGQRSSEGHVDLPRLREGGVDVQVFAVFVEPQYLPARGMKRALQMIAALKQQLLRHHEHAALAGNVADARRIVAQGRIAAFLGLEGGYAIRGDRARLRQLYRQGVRYMTLTWRDNTSWADGSEDEPRHHGLTELGRKIVREMNRLGMVVDVSHVSDETFWDVLETSRHPVIASHSNARALCDHPRNLSDPMLRALAKNGGVVGVNFVAGFLDQEFSTLARRRIEAIEPELERLRKGCKEAKDVCREKRRKLYREALRGLPPVPLSRVLDHIDHIVRVAGVDHVGLGSDFDGFGTGPQGLEDVSRVPRITAGLLARGYSEQDVRKILGENFMRVFAKVLGP